LDGIITLSLHNTEKQIQRIFDCQIEMVMIEYLHHMPTVSTIDDWQGGVIAADHLLKKGHKKFGIVCELSKPDYSVFPILPRMEGFRYELIRNNQKLKIIYIFDVPCEIKGTYQRFIEVLNQAIFRMQFLLQPFGSIRYSKSQRKNREIGFPKM
jgi:DNA-binding LacI/PurR family transcriptional regulator